MRAVATGLMPRSPAASRSWEVARIAWPSQVRWKKNPSNEMSTTKAPIT